MIPALNPAVPRSKVKLMADWCNENGYDHYRFIYSAATLALEGLLYDDDTGVTEALAELIYLVCPTDKLKFLSVLFTLKALVTTCRPPFVWLSEYSAAGAALPAGEINALAAACRKDDLAVLDLLDVALCRALVEELLENENPDKEEAELNWPLLIDSADAGKILGQGLKGLPLDDRVGVLLRILQKMTGNILGSCGKENQA